MSNLACTLIVVAYVLAFRAGCTNVSSLAVVSRNVIDTPPEFLTITIVNSRDRPISTSHALAVGSPPPLWGDNGPGTIGAGSTAAFAVPTDWVGNVAVADVLAQNGSTQSSETGDSSLIEANFAVSDQYGMAIADIDVSYVDGFSDPITCLCAGFVVAGCNLDLWSLNPCPNRTNIACINPLRADTNATAAVPFFAPCQGAAYTFPHDDGANSWAQCQNGHIMCCVGERCPPNPKQQSAKRNCTL
ncbi:hypothetical protein BX600DRAFT_501185 [Xylariales sp. PMI_506]|nr:hypothetical protein BX600DRAFT_501185 [Xylariales sp. PMI_506]